MKIALDWDGTLAERKEIPRGNVNWSLIKPNEHAVDFCYEAMSRGHELYVCTARSKGDFPKIREWLVKHKFPDMDITNRKRLGTTIYLDDRAIRFTNFLDISKLI